MMNEDEAALQDILAASEEIQLTSSVDLNREYEETGTVDICVAWQEKRRPVNAQRQARGFAPLQLPPQNLKDLISRTS